MIPRALGQAAPRDTRLLLASMVISTIPMGYLNVVLPLYLNRIGFEPWLIGILYTVSGLVQAILVVGSGVLADRLGRQRFVFWGTALPILSYLVFAATTDVPWLVVASTLGGVGLANGAAGAMMAASFDALLAEHTPARYRTRVFTWAQVLWGFALAAGATAAGIPLALAALTGNPDSSPAYRASFLALVLLAAVGTLVMVPVRERAATGAVPEREQKHQHPPRSGSRGWLPHRSLGAIVRYSLGIGLLGLGLGIAVQLLPLWFRLRFGVTEDQIGLWLAAPHVLSLGAVVLSPWMEHRFGTARAILLAQSTACVMLAFAAFAGSFEVAATLIVLRSLAANVSWPLQQALLMTAVVPEERASAAGIGFAVWGLSNAIGPAIGGALLNSGSLTLPLVIGSLGYLVGGLVFDLGFGGGRLSVPLPTSTPDPEPVA